MGISVHSNISAGTDTKNGRYFRCIRRRLLLQVAKQSSELESRWSRTAYRHDAGASRCGELGVIQIFHVRKGKGYIDGAFNRGVHLIDRSEGGGGGGRDPDKKETEVGEHGGGEGSGGSSTMLV
jgi:hypothetical protein